MKIETIAVFPNTLSQFDVLSHFTQGLILALKRLGIQTDLLVPNKKDPMSFLSKIYREQPDCTLSFNGLLPNEFGEFLCDQVEIPHVCCLVDSAHFFSVLRQSPLNVIACCDLASCDIFQSWNSTALFMPHGIDKALTTESLGEKPFDVVFIGSSIDFLAILDKWRSNLDPKTVTALLECAEAVLKDPALPYQKALTAFVPPEQFDSSTYEKLMQDVDLYIRGRDRVELIQSIQETDVHIFGPSLGARSWKELLGSKPHRAIIHHEISYLESLNVMRESKIVLNSSPMFKFGGHERIFLGMALGALVISNETAFLKDQFVDGEDLALYTPSDKSGVSEVIKKYLTDEPLRKKMAINAREKVARSHTWDKRAAKLIADLEPILEKMFSE